MAGRAGLVPRLVQAVHQSLLGRRAILVRIRRQRGWERVKPKSVLRRTADSTDDGAVNEERVGVRETISLRV